MLRRPDSIPATDTVIEDPAMEPFFITNSASGGYTVYERVIKGCLLYTSPSPRDAHESRMPSSA